MRRRVKFKPDRRTTERAQLLKEYAVTHEVPKGLEAYFPPCTNPLCERRGRHADVLPHQIEFIAAPEKYVALVGGYGAGKTLPAAVLGVQLSKQVRGNRGFVGRRTYSKLHDSTLPIYLEVLQRVGVQFELREVRDGWPHRVVLPNDSEIIFRETKDIGRFLGPEYGWFHLDEAAEEPERTFTDLQGRLRLPHASTFLKGFITSNPPHQTDWIPRLFGLMPGVTTRGTSRYRLMQVSSRLNPYLPESYIQDLLANHTAAEAKRIVDGQYGFSYEGEAVYAPPFDYGKHVAEIKPQLGITLVRSWDFGYHRPCVTWHQFPLCDQRRPHWLVVGAFLGKAMEAETLGDTILDMTKTLAPDHARAMILDCGDKAGAAVSDKGPGPITRLGKKPWFLQFRTRNLPDVNPGIALVRAALRDSCACGRPIMQISRTCGDVIDTLAGGYHYPSTGPHNRSERREKPYKDGFYDNVADTIRYAAENFYRGLLREPGLLDRLVDQNAPMGLDPLPEPYAWMGP